jgi:hypothetical protein
MPDESEGFEPELTLYPELPVPEPVVTTTMFTPAEQAAWQVAVDRGLSIEAADVRAMLAAAAESDEDLPPPLPCCGTRVHYAHDPACQGATP